MRVTFENLKQELERVLLKIGFEKERAQTCARLFAETDLDGVYSHGLNRFPRFLQYISKGYVAIQNEPVLLAKHGALERWNGQNGPGNLNARFAMEQAMQLARENGLGCVALQNTNHWMRGGTYGWQAANAGLIGICFTNTMPNLPPWGGKTPTLGNNPLVIAVPRSDGRHVVLDMAVSQFSYGKLQVTEEAGKKLPVAGGYDAAGNITNDPTAIQETGRVLPIGFWKGSGLSLLLDLLTGLLSGGLTTSDIVHLTDEQRLSQVFICMDVSRLSSSFIIDQVVEQVLTFTKTSELVEADKPVQYPGENTWRTRQENLELGIPVNETVWQQILAY